MRRLTVSIGKVITKHYRDKVNEAVSQFCNASILPQEGWLRTVRIALGMSGTQLAKRLGVTKARISKAEQAEPAGSVTLRTMRSMAGAMGCKFVYAVIPQQNVEDVIKKRAVEKARIQIQSTSSHMMHEVQPLSNEQLNLEIERVTAQIMDKMPAHLWSD